MRHIAEIRNAALLAAWIQAGAVMAGGYVLQAQEADSAGTGRRADKGAHSVEIRPYPRDDFRVTVDTDRSVYAVGDAVQVRFRASSDCVVYIFNTDSDGVTRQIFPNYYDRDNAVKGNRRYAIPMGRYWLVTTGPPGRESLRIMAYRRPWRVLDSWNEFRSGDPFPQRSVAPDEMRKRAEAEARATREDATGWPDGDRDRGRIVPVPPPPPKWYAEDWAEFRVEESRHPRDPW